VIPRSDTDLARTCDVHILPARRVVDVVGLYRSPLRLSVEGDGVPLPGGGWWSRRELTERAARRGWLLRWVTIDPMAIEPEGPRGPQT